VTAFKSPDSGLILAFPWIIVERLAASLAPGFSPRREKRVFGIASSLPSSCLFAVGAYFAYFAVLHAGRMAFLATYTKGATPQNWRKGFWPDSSAQLMTPSACVDFRIDGGGLWLASRG